MFGGTGDPIRDYNIGGLARPEARVLEWIARRLPARVMPALKEGVTPLARRSSTRYGRI
jgi:hypothetical protein